MASGRFRVPSQGKIDLFDQVMPIEPPTRRPPLKPMQQVAAVGVPRKEQQPLKGMFTLGTPEREKTTQKDEGLGDFLRVCSLCKKKLKPVEDIYMYGYLGAFCSADCRDDRIALDAMDMKVLKVPKDMRPSKRF